MTVLTHPTAARTRSDAELVAQLRSGHAEAFEAIVDRYAAPLQAFARSLLSGAHHDAEEVVQDALLRALAGLRRDDREVLLRPWLYRICRNACIDRLRRVTPTVDLAALESVLPGSGGDPHATAVGREELAALVGALRGLPERQRVALLALTVEGDSHEQVAERLAVSVSATKALVCRARQHLVAARDVA